MIHHYYLDGEVVTVDIFPSWQWPLCLISSANTCSDSAMETELRRRFPRSPG